MRKNKGRNGMNEKWIQRRLKKITLVLGGICGMLLISGWIASILMGRMFEKEINGQIVTEAERYVTNINRKIEADTQTLATLASFMEFSENMDTDQFVKGLYESNNQNSFIKMGYFGKNSTGIQVTLNGGIEGNIKAEETEPELYKAIQKGWNGERAFSDVYHDSGAQEDFVAYAVPVKHEGTVTGTLIACSSTSVFFDVMKIRSGFSRQGGNAGIVTLEGDFIVGLGEAATDASQASIYDGDMLSEKSRELFEKAVNKNESAFFEMKNDGEQCRGFVEAIGVNNWYLVFAATEKEINEFAYRNMIVTRVGYICILSFTTIAGLYVYRLIKKYNRELLKFAYYDPLTGACNMVKFSYLLEEILGSRGPFCIGAVNIRKFKFINEIFGDKAANQLLCYMKESIEEELCQGEFFCRETADKFYILMLTEDKETVKQRIKNITENVRKKFQNKYREYGIMIYSGVVTGSDTDSKNLKKEELMSHVMFVLNQARTGNTDDVCFYNAELYKKEQLGNYIESHMEQALAEGEFRLFLQPKINLRKDILGGAEALVRWVSEEGKMIFPDQFIPVFENNGFCTELDLYMVEQVCRQMREWMDKYGKAIPVSVNQTKLLFYKEGYVERLSRIVDKYKIPAHMITLEILEGLALEDTEELNSRIRELKKKGFKISMDDFGSGYSSLNILSGLDIDEIKFDRAFLMKKTKHKTYRQQLIMGQIVELAGKMKIITVAEGVETPEDEAFILNAGCDFGQGYYYSRPISAEEFTEKYIK